MYTYILTFFGLITAISNNYYNFTILIYMLVLNQQINAMMFAGYGNL